MGEALTAPDLYDPTTLRPRHRDADDTTTSARSDQPATAPRFSKPVVIGFVAVVAVVTLGLAAAMVGMQSSPTEAPHRRRARRLTPPWRHLHRHLPLR